VAFLTHFMHGTYQTDSLHSFSFKLFSDNNQYKWMSNIILWNTKLCFSYKIVSDKDSGKILTDILKK